MRTFEKVPIRNSEISTKKRFFHSKFRYGGVLGGGYDQWSKILYQYKKQQHNSLPSMYTPLLRRWFSPMPTSNSVACCCSCSCCCCCAALLARCCCCCCCCNCNRCCCCCCCCCWFSSAMLLLLLFRLNVSV